MDAAWQSWAASVQVGGRTILYFPWSVFGGYSHSNTRFLQGQPDASCVQILANLAHAIV